MPVNRFGWVPNPEETAKFVRSLPYASFAGALDGGLYGDDGNALLYKALMTAAPELVKDGRLIARNQSSIGSCVGHGTATGVDATYACEVVIKKEPEKWAGRCAADAAYGLSRQVVNQNGGWEGSNGSWAAKAVMEIGTLHMVNYEGIIDLSEYTVSRCRQFQRQGLNETLRQKAGEHKMGTAALVRTVEEAKVALQNGYAINVCSNQGFSGKRDELGFMKGQGSWAHSMVILGYRGPASGREGFLIQNSWGSDWGSGPFWEDQPWGSFWCVPDTLSRMLRGGDSFAYSAYNGFPRQRLPFDFLTDFEVEAPKSLYGFLTQGLNTEN